jgi:Nuclease-related domain
MEIRNQGQGVHAREIHGLGKLRHLPKEWYAYTNLEVSVGPGQYREIDAVMVTDDRVLLVDLKDWKQRITCGEGRWYLCVPKTLSVLMWPRNHLSWRNDRAPVFRRGGLGLTIQVEDPA